MRFSLGVRQVEDVAIYYSDDSRSSPTTMVPPCLRTFPPGDLPHLQP